VVRGEVTGSRGQRWTVEVPQTRTERARGLLGRDEMEPSAGMLFERTSSVHTFGMRFPIVVAFLGRPDPAGRRTARRVLTMTPGRVAPPRPGVRAVLELPAGSDVRVGDAILCRLSTAGSTTHVPIV
jgi:uncharacterized protein